MPAQTSQPAAVGIRAPVQGDALQGVVTVRGSTAVDDFERAEISFAYADNPTHTWFPLAQSDTAVRNADLTHWDTTLITDGDYVLRLQVFFNHGQVVTDEIGGLRVRNYTAVETREPSPTLEATMPTAALSVSTQAPLLSPTATFLPLPTSPALPANPAQMTYAALESSLIQGVLAVVAVFSALGAYLGLKAGWRKF